MRLAVDSFPEVAPDSYPSLRSKIKTGDILLCSGSGVFSRLIQDFTDSCWSHVGLVLRVRDLDRVMVIESMESIGVRTVPMSHYMTYDGRVAIARHDEFPADDREALNKLSQFALDLMGSAYDKGEIARIAGRIARSKLPLLGERSADLERDEEYICSEYAWECYSSIGLNVKFDKRGFVAPKDFAACPEVHLVGVMR